MVYPVRHFFDKEFGPAEEKDTVFFINEIFYSIQGEGLLTGWPAIFIRLAGCNLSCPWCDTDHTTKAHMRKEDIYRAIDKILDTSIAGGHCNVLFVITGGEPTIQDWLSLVLHLAVQYDNPIALETNGRCCDDSNMRRLRETGRLWVTVSPKFDVEDCSSYLENPAWGANEMKVVLSPEVDREMLENIPGQLADRISFFWIQPCSEDNKTAIEFVKENPLWRLSLQTQKAAGFR